MPGRAIDVGLGGAAVAVPLWVHNLSDWMQVLTIALGAALVAVRLAIVVRDCWGRCRRSRRKDGQ